MNELHQLLTDCREKLQLYRDQHSGEWLNEVGGVEFTALRDRIDAALAKPLHCATCQCNKLNQPTASPKNPLSRSWHENAATQAPKS